jgi:cytochrome c oxidase subunit I+III
VAHLHYVLIGGMVFPLFAAIYYWVPAISRNALSERVGRWVFGLTFAGFHVAFFPMHIAGMAGMPRRVHTYALDSGWGMLNLVSTIGAFIIAAGVLLFIIDFARRFRLTFEGNAGNVWNAGTLEWLPNGTYSSRSIPIIESDYPLWQQPGLAERVEAGAYYLPNAASGGRDTLITSAFDARPQFVLRMPMPGWAPVIGAWFTAACFLLLTFKLVWLSAACGVVAVAALWHWGWGLDPPADRPPVPIGGGITLPIYVSGPQSQAWWAMVVLMLVSASMYACLVFSYLFLWTSVPRMWDRPPPPWAWGLSAAVLAVASSAAVGWANRRLSSRGRIGMLAPAILLLGGAFACSLVAHAAAKAKEDGYGAVVNAFLVVDGFFFVTASTLAVFALARSHAGKLDARRRVTFDNARIFWHYTVVQTLVGIALLHLFPRGVA